MQPQPPLLRTLRLIIATSAGSLFIFLAVLVLVGLDLRQPDVLWLALPLLLGLADLVLVPAVGSTVRPLPMGVSEADARRISVGVLNTVTLLRFALAEAPALFGLVAAFASHSILPYAIGFAFALPLLLLFVYPRAAVVDGIRDNLESGGARSHLWEALSGRP